MYKKVHEIIFTYLFIINLQTNIHTSTVHITLALYTYSVSTL